MMKEPVDEEPQPGPIWQLVVVFYAIPVVVALAAGWWADEPMLYAAVLFAVLEVASALISALTAVGWGDEWRHNIGYFLRWSLLNLVVVGIAPALAALRK